MIVSGDVYSAAEYLVSIDAVVDGTTKTAADQTQTLTSSDLTFTFALT